jgi:hypothetical protein
MMKVFSKLKSLNKNKVQSSVISNYLSFSFSTSKLDMFRFEIYQWSKFTQTLVYLVMRTVTDISHPE